MPNRNVPSKPSDYACSIDKIEGMTGLDFFSGLPGQTQEKLKSSFDIKAWNFSKTQARYPAYQARTNQSDRKEYLRAVKCRFGIIQQPLSAKPDRTRGTGC